MQRSYSIPERVIPSIATCLVFLWKGLWTERHDSDTVLSLPSRATMVLETHASMQHLSWKPA